MTIPKSSTTQVEDVAIWVDAMQVGTLICMAKTLSDEETTAFLDVETKRLIAQGLKPQTILRNLQKIKELLFALKVDLTAPGEPPQNKPPEKPVGE